jgi:hypothetical protein
VNCPWCAARFDRPVDADGSADAPVEGDVAVCADCLRPALFTDATPLTLRRPDPLEQVSLELDPQFRKWVARLRLVRTYRAALN